ncbi:MAG: PEP/pyruvate-binding domain-containing protein, partial [Bacteroidales bacterium]
DEHRTYLVNLIKDYRITSGQGVIAKFDSSTYNRYIWFARIGEGSIGGKARGLAFLNSLVQKYSLARKYQGVELTIPRTMVLATDIFDDFIVNNGLQYVISSDKATDDEILSEFVSSQLPESVLAELKVFIETVNTPLAVRSSSKLEDSNFQPFAGIYSTYMSPLTENRDQMLRLLAKAVKSVYASVYFARSRTYIHTTANLLTEEKMGIVIQSICGSEDHGFYFPTLSGVARSVNFYPIGYEKPEEGIVNMAYGLGKLVVEGGKSLRFSPKHPDHILQTSTTRLALVETQEDMYALDLSPEEFKTSIDDGVNIHKFSIEEASRFRNIKHVASTYDYQNDRISPGTFEMGRRLITFDNILKYDTLPLAQILRDLLEICKSELRCNVEMEFAMDMDVAEGEDAKFNLLNVRPVTDNESLGTFVWDSVIKEGV